MCNWDTFGGRKAHCRSLWRLRSRLRSEAELFKSIAEDGGLVWIVRIVRSRFQWVIWAEATTALAGGFRAVLLYKSIVDSPQNSIPRALVWGRTNAFAVLSNLRSSNYVYFVFDVGSLLRLCSPTFCYFYFIISLVKCRRENSLVCNIYFSLLGLSKLEFWYARQILISRKTFAQFSENLSRFVFEILCRFAWASPNG